MEIRAEYTEALIKQVTRRFLFRLIGWHGFVVVGIGYLFLAYLVVSGDRSWYAGAFGAVLLIASGVGVAVYFIVLRRSLWVLRRMTDPSTMFTFTDASLATKTDLGTSELKWQGIVKVWTFPEAWLLFVGRGIYVTIPTSTLTEEARELIRSKVCAHGGKVV